MACHGLLRKMGIASGLMLIGTTISADPAASQPRVIRKSSVCSPVWNRLRNELLLRAKCDQVARKAFLEWASLKGVELARMTEFEWQASEPAAELLKIDHDNIAWLKEIVAQYGWPGSSRVGQDGSHAAWLIVQHASSAPDFQKSCLVLMQQAPPGEVDRSDIAFLVDRIRTNEGQKQIFGTQLEIRDGHIVLAPVDDPESLERRRSEIGLPPVAVYLDMAREIYQIPATLTDP
jgi:hypothetical protein